MTTFLWIVGIIVALYIYLLLRKPAVPTSHWQRSFDGFQFSAEDFYEQVRKGIQSRETPSVKFDEESFVESHILSGRRKYLRITFAEYVFYVSGCAFGTGSFASWWLCVKQEGILNRIPILSKLMGKDRNDKTFYQQDTEAMYRAMVHGVVTDVLDGLTGAQGLRPLTELEKQYTIAK